MEALLIPCISVLLNRRGSTLLDLQRFIPGTSHLHRLTDMRSYN